MSEEVPATPLVRKLARQHGVDLASVKATGVGGRIRKDDVLAAVARKPAVVMSDDELYTSLFGDVTVPARLVAADTGSRAVAAATGPRAVEQISRFDPARRVSIDPWGRNPVVDDFRQVAPAAYAAATREAPAPTMFAGGGDLPAFTASGVEPQLLLRLPWGVRHAAAASSDRSYVLQLLEERAGDPDAMIPGPGLEEYIARVRNWAMGTAAPRYGD